MQNLKCKIQYYGRSFAAAFLLLVVCCILPVASSAAEKWPGVDEAVVQKYAKEQGREAHEPLINTNQGDLLLFVFLIAGSIGGFAAGYYWRVLIERTPSKKEESPETGSK